jgi:uncharacterized membrane protein YbhN (UPF0104 family)
MPRTLGVALRVAAGLLLLAAVVWWVDPARLRAQLSATSLPWFAAAVVCAIAANLLSAWRWQQIARGLTLRAPLSTLTLAYAQGIAVNTVLPGATLGGDALRGIQLARCGNDALRSALSVVLDRASGLWVLCALSLLASLLLLALAPARLLSAQVGALSMPLIAAVATALLVALLLPLMVAPPAAPRMAGTPLARLHRLRTAIFAQRGTLLRTMPSSVGVQLLSAGTLWLCVQAAGGDSGYLAVLMVAAPVFLAAALPVSVGGFGPREAAAALSFPWIGATAELGVAAALLYGLTAAVQAVLAAPLLAVSRAAGGADTR